METPTKKLKIYCETSFWSYLVGSPTSDEKVARWQALTRKWWEEIAPRCEIYVSQYVIKESSAGNAQMAALRLKFIEQSILVEGRDTTIRLLATKLHEAHAVPVTQNTDALHISASVMFGVDVLLTWNCKHLANPITLPKTIAAISKAGYDCPVIITPEVFLARKEEFGL